MKPLQFRQGDVFVVSVDTMPTDGTVLKEPILAFGEATGHHHKLSPLNLDQTYMCKEVGPDGKPTRNTVPMTGAALLEQSGLEYVKGEMPKLVEKNGEIFFELKSTTVLTHNEHGAIALPPGTYKNVIQQEYLPGAVPQRVID